ncbi:hypothetical protein L345_06758, partial [Ophiophagus hannah]
APSAPGRVVATRNTKTSVIVNWEKPKHEEDLIGYYLDYSVVGSNHWEPCNHKPIKYNRFTMHGLTTGEKYIFRVKAANAVGMSENSQESDSITVQAALTCPSYPYGITLLNCDGQSMTIGWKLPRYSGGSNILGYYLDKREAEHHNWHEVNSSLIKERIYKVEDLQENAYYEFKIAAANITGVGKSSEPSELYKCEAWKMPEPGPPYDLTFCEIRNTSLVILWKAPIYIGNSPVTGYFVDYKEEEEENWTTFNEKPTPHHYSKVTELHEGKCYIFRVRPVNDAGIGKASDISEAVLVQAKPAIPLKSELAYEILDKGEVRFWIQTEGLSPEATYRFIINDSEVSNSDRHKIKCDHATGTIEMVMDHFTLENEGTYTVQLQDGKAKGQSSLVLIGDGPHFEEYLHWEVTDECEVLLLCKVANTKKETFMQWYRDGAGVNVKEPPDFQKGVCCLTIPKLSKKDQGEYKTTLSDDRGQDISELDVSGKVYDDIIQGLSRISGKSASPLKIHCTPEGIRLQCFLKYYMEEMKSSWYHKEAKVSSSEKMRIGGSDEVAWIQICEPTEKDKGKYTFELSDGKEAHKRTLDLSGQAFDEAYEEFQRLKAAAFAEKNRGKVVGGLPDVVTIMEDKTLNLTCNVFGSPDPEVIWFKNDRELELSDHYIAKLEQGKHASLVIKGVSSEDSGKYSISVKNKYGGEIVDVTISVYKHGEEIPDVKPLSSDRVREIPAKPAE